jgi:hypothetical protein
MRTTDPPRPASSPAPPQPLGPRRGPIPRLARVYVWRARVRVTWLIDTVSRRRAPDSDACSLVRSEPARS